MYLSVPILKDSSLAGCTSHILVQNWSVLSVCSPWLHEDSKRMPGDTHSRWPRGALHTMHGGLEQAARVYLCSSGKS